jgi:hypothetical protein
MYYYFVAPYLMARAFWSLSQCFKNLSFRAGIARDAVNNHEYTYRCPISLMEVGWFSKTPRILSVQHISSVFTDEAIMGAGKA